MDGDVRVANFLEALGLSEYLPLFNEHHIDIDTLSRLDSADLREIGICSLGHRKLILDRIAANTPAAREEWIAGYGDPGSGPTSKDYVDCLITNAHPSVTKNPFFSLVVLGGFVALVGLVMGIDVIYFEGELVEEGVSRHWAWRAMLAGFILVGFGRLLVWATYRPQKSTCNPRAGDSGDRSVENIVESSYDRIGLEAPPAAINAYNPDDREPMSTRASCLLWIALAIATILILLTVFPRD